MAKNYIPGPDAEFDTWFEAFNTMFAGMGATLGFSVSEINALNNSFTSWQLSYTDHVTTQNAARSAQEAKTDARLSAEERIRKYVKRIQAHQNTTNAIRASLGITVPKDSKTHPQVPAVAPGIETDWSQRGQVTLFFGTSPGKKRNNPFAEFAVAVLVQFRYAGGEWQHLSLTKKKEFTHVINNTEPITVQYRATYLNANDQQGPWSESDFAYVAPVQVGFTVVQDAA